MGYSVGSFSACWPTVRTCGEASPIKARADLREAEQYWYKFSAVRPENVIYRLNCSVLKASIPPRLKIFYIWRAKKWCVYGRVLLAFPSHSINLAKAINTLPGINL